jgi:hypothetical protein
MRRRDFITVLGGDLRATLKFLPTRRRVAHQAFAAFAL